MMEGGVLSGVYNIGSEDTMEIRELVSLFLDLTKSPEERAICVEAKKGAQVLDITKLRYSQIKTYTIKETMKWYLNLEKTIDNACLETGS